MERKVSKDHESVKSLLSNLIGKKVLKVNAGGSTGSVFSLDIGDRLISEEKNGYTFWEGEFFVMVNCSWRLDNLRNNKPVTGWQENSDPHGAMTVRLKTLLNDYIESISINSFFDLEVTFKSKMRLLVFCDLTPDVNAESNWFFKSGDKYYSITTSLVCEEGK
jgi:hypothetical protein